MMNGWDSEVKRIEASGGNISACVKFSKVEMNDEYVLGLDNLHELTEFYLFMNVGKDGASVSVSTNSILPEGTPHFHQVKADLKDLAISNQVVDLIQNANAADLVFDMGDEITLGIMDQKTKKTLKLIDVYDFRQGCFGVNFYNLRLSGNLANDENAGLLIYKSLLSDVEFKYKHKGLHVKVSDFAQFTDICDGFNFKSVRVTAHNGTTEEFSFGLYVFKPDCESLDPLNGVEVADSFSGGLYDAAYTANSIPFYFYGDDLDQDISFVNDSKGLIVGDDVNLPKDSVLANEILNQVIQYCAEKYNTGLTMIALSPEELDDHEVLKIKDGVLLPSKDYIISVHNGIGIAVTDNKIAISEGDVSVDHMLGELRSNQESQSHANA